MKIYLLSILLFTSYLINAQNTFEKLNEVSKKMFKIDSVKNKLIDTFHIKFDNASMKVKRYENIIETEGYVGESKNLLKVTYYLKLNELQVIQSKEVSPILSDLYMQWIFNVEKNQIVNEFPSHTVRSCISMPRNENLYETYGYNEKWNAKFLKKILMKLYTNIKNYR